MTAHSPDPTVELEFVGKPKWTPDAVDVLVRIIRKAREREATPAAERAS